MLVKFQYAIILNFRSLLFFIAFFVDGEDYTVPMQQVYPGMYVWNH